MLEYTWHFQLISVATFYHDGLDHFLSFQTSQKMVKVILLPEESRSNKKATLHI